MTTGGLEDVVVADSRICDLDGKLGKLTYFGVDIHDLARYSSFEETAYLLWHGALPTKAQLEELKGELIANRALPPPILGLMRLLPTTTPPMDALRTTASSVSSFDPYVSDRAPARNYHRAILLTAQLPTILAAWNLM